MAHSSATGDDDVHDNDVKTTVRGTKSTRKLLFDTRSTSHVHSKKISSGKVITTEWYLWESFEITWFGKTLISSHCTCHVGNTNSSSFVTCSLTVSFNHVSLRYQLLLLGEQELCSNLALLFNNSIYFLISQRSRVKHIDTWEICYDLNISLEMLVLVIFCSLDRTVAITGLTTKCC